jgi:hypothetical protein
MSPTIVLREVIASDSKRFAKGHIMPWPADKDPPPGMIWLREQVYVIGSRGEALLTTGDITPAAAKIMQEISAP